MSFDPIFVHRMTPTRAGVGGANTAIADDHSALYINPAGLSRKAEYRYFSLGQRFYNSPKNFGIRASFIDGKSEDPIHWGFLFNFDRTKKKSQFQDYVLGTSLDFSNYVLVGLSHRLTRFQHKLFTPDHWSYGLNVGTLLFLNDFIALGFAADNLYRYYKNSLLTPFIYRGGISGNFENLRMGVDVERNHSQHKNYLRVGLESRHITSFVLRGGFYSEQKKKDLGYSLGLALEPSSSLQINFGFIDQLKSSDFYYSSDLILRF